MIKRDYVTALVVERKFYDGRTTHNSFKRYANELVETFRDNTEFLQSIALNTNSSIETAITCAMDKQGIELPPILKRRREAGFVSDAWM